MWPDHSKWAGALLKVIILIIEESELDIAV